MVCSASRTVVVSAMTAVVVRPFLAPDTTTVGARIVVTWPFNVTVCGDGVGACCIDRTVVVDGACVSSMVTDTVFSVLSESVTVWTMVVGVAPSFCPPSTATTE